MKIFKQISFQCDQFEQHVLSSFPAPNSQNRLSTSIIDNFLYVYQQPGDKVVSLLLHAKEVSERRWRYRPSSPGKLPLARAPQRAGARPPPRATEAAVRAPLAPPRAGGPPARPRATTPRPRPAWPNNIPHIIRKHSPPILFHSNIHKCQLLATGLTTITYI